MKDINVDNYIFMMQEVSLRGKFGDREETNIDRDMEYKREPKTTL